MKSDAQLSPLPAGRSEVLCFKSWTAYIRPTVLAAVAVLVAALTLEAFESVSLTFAIVIAILGAFAASVLTLRRATLTIDDEGVWYCRGGLGARPRMVGVRWPYVRCSLSEPRIGWPRTSSTIIVRNRVTTRVILVEHMARGDLAVARINNLQRMRLRDTR